jgi:hypothetical protein
VSEPIVTVTHTVMSGVVVRWFTSLEAADRCEPVLSASRERVMFHGRATADTVPAEWQEAAQAAHEALAAQRYSYWEPTPESVTALATHKTQLFGPPVPIRKEWFAFQIEDE